MGIKLSPEGKAVAVSMSKAPGFVRVRGGVTAVLPRVSMSQGGLRRLVEAFQSLPERSRNLTNVEAVFASIEREEQSDFAWGV